MARRKDAEADSPGDRVPEVFFPGLGNFLNMGEPGAPPVRKSHHDRLVQAKRFLHACLTLIPP